MSATTMEFGQAVPEEAPWRAELGRLGQGLALMALGGAVQVSCWGMLTSKSVEGAIRGAVLFPAVTLLTCALCAPALFLASSTLGVSLPARALMTALTSSIHRMGLMTSGLAPVVGLYGLSSSADVALGVSALALVPMTGIGVISFVAKMAPFALTTAETLAAQSIAVSLVVIYALIAVVVAGYLMAGGFAL
jgi:hypothetical protein